MDTEDLSTSESVSLQPPKTFNLNNHSQLRLTSKKDRLDINTVPVDRPRSTTPINVASLEAFIKSATLPCDNGVEKIKVSLPSDVFSGGSRSRSPRPSNPQIWLDFCEKGLQSPKIWRQKDSLGISNLDLDDAFTPVTNNSPSTAVTPLTPISPLEPNDLWTPFGDDFGSMKIQDNADLNQLMMNVSKCNKCDCQNSNDYLVVKDGESFKNTNKVENSEIDDQVFEGCDCSCHSNNNKSVGTNNNNENCEKQNLFSSSSNISSASSRLIQASSSSIDDIENKFSP